MGLPKVPLPPLPLLPSRRGGVLSPGPDAFTCSWSPCFLGTLKPPQGLVRCARLQVGPKGSEKRGVELSPNRCRCRPSTTTWPLTRMSCSLRLVMWCW